jgi:hypothetical protein
MITTRSPKLTTCLRVAGRKRVDMDSATPRMSPPTRAPTRFPMPPQNDHDKGGEREIVAQVGGKGHQRQQQRTRGTGCGRPQPEGEVVDAAHIDAHKRRRHAVIGRRPDAFAHVAFFQEHKDGHGNDDGKGKGDEARHIDHGTAQPDGIQAEGGLGTAVIRPPQYERRVFENNPDGHQGKDLHGFGVVEDSVDHGRLNHVSQHKNGGGYNDQGEVGIDAQEHEYPIGNVHADDHHLAMGEIDHPHYPENEGEPQGDEPIEPSQQNTLNQ